MLMRRVLLKGASKEMPAETAKPTPGA